MSSLNTELLSVKSSGIELPVKFYVLVGSMALMLFVTGCANDTAIYSDPSNHGQPGATTAAPEEGAPPTPTEPTATPTAPSDESSKVPEQSTESKVPPPVNPSQPKPWQPAPATTSSTQPAAVSYPKATRVPGKTNRVISPYAPYAGEVDVGGFASGDQVKCPYTGKIFIVP